MPFISDINFEKGNLKKKGMQHYVYYFPLMQFLSISFKKSSSTYDGTSSVDQFPGYLSVPDIAVAR